MNDYANMHYMVIFKLPDQLTNEMLNMIPKQRLKVDRMMKSGKLVAYTLAADRTVLWAIFLGTSVEDVEKQVNKLPMTHFFQYDIQELMFHMTPGFLPAFSVN